MRATKFLVCFMLAQLCVSALMAQWPATTNTNNGRFWMETGASIFDRPGSDLGLPLVTNSVTNDVLITSDSATDLNGALGPNIKIGSTSRLGIDWETSLAYGNWSTESTAEGPNLISPFFPPALDPDQIGFTHDSQFFDFQFNLRKAVFPGMTFLIGPRYLYMNDDLVLTSNTEFSIPGTGTFQFDTRNDVITRNSGFGGTIGMEFNQPVARDIYLQGFVRASGLLTQSRLERRSITTTDALLVQNQDKSTATFIGQAGGRVYFDIIPQTVAAYTGYEATWVDGTATAPSQALTIGATDVVTSNTIFWHAINFGLKFTY